MNLVESTSPKTVRVPHQARWISYREDRSCDAKRTFIFTDGSSNGGYAAVIVRNGKDLVKSRGWETPTSTKNVGPELNGMLLGLRQATEGESITMVSDYLGVAAWMTENWKIKDPEVRDKIREAKEIVARLNLDLDFIHHGGHQKDTSAFTQFNNLADKLAGVLK